MRCINFIENIIRAHKEGCLSELEGIESHMKTKEQEKFQLEKELSRLKRAVLKGGATEHPQQGKDNKLQDTQTCRNRQT